eukprot:Skav205329  [mRNA]  locus=scaffold3444:382473:382883:+ [translate_table: standard]
MVANILVGGCRFSALSAISCQLRANLMRHEWKVLFKGSREELLELLVMFFPRWRLWPTQESTKPVDRPGRSRRRLSKASPSRSSVVPLQPKTCSHRANGICRHKLPTPKCCAIDRAAVLNSGNSLVFEYMDRWQTL